MSTLATSPFVDGYVFLEGPRWHDGRLWVSDIWAHKVYGIEEDGRAEIAAEVPGRPSGLGFLPDGTPLIVSMHDRCVYRLEHGVLQLHADLSRVASAEINDMVVDDQGRAYVGNFGFNTHENAEGPLADLIRVDPDGSASIAAEGFHFPNGAVITPDGKTLIIGETRANRLSAFDVAADGSLSNRRVWADLGENYPDGICLDAEGAVWVADPRNKETIRVKEGGDVTMRVSTGARGSFACMLGGDDRKTLYICTSGGSGPKAAERRDGCIESIRVAVPGAGWP